MKKSKKTVAVYIFSICCSLGLAKVSFADEPVNNVVRGDRSFYTKLFGGLNLLRDTDLESGGSSPLPEGKASFDSGHNVGLAVGYNILEELSIELEYAYRSNDFDKVVGQSGNFARSGDLASVAIMFNALYYPKVSNSFSPYIGGGIGMLQEIDSDIRFADDESINDLEDSTLALQIITGIEVPLYDSLTVFGEARYLGAPGPELSKSGQSYDLDYNSFSSNLGIKFTF